jgi:deoxyribose-phosphate aldolase
MTPSELAKIIDHTALRPETTEAQILQLCAEAREFGFGAVCIAPAWVALAVEQLADTRVKTVSVVGFPHGDTLSTVKAIEASQAIAAGAQELDMVIPVGALKSGKDQVVLQGIRAVVGAARQRAGTLVKVILETALLRDSEKVLGCRLAEQAGADFVKTSTGFAAGGATVNDVALLRRTVGDRLGVKAAGGIRDLAAALAMVKAGASRLSCSSSVAIMQAFTNEPPPA